VGSDIALANAMAREIIAAGLEDRAFIERATDGFEAYKAKVESYTLEYAERETGVPAEAIRELAHAFATADKAMICWTLGITEHHNAVDNVLALISLVLLTGHVGRYGSGVNPLRGQNNVQGGGDMGALPDRLPGFQHVENDELRARFEAEWGVPVPPKRGWHLSGMFDAMERGDLTAVYCIGENPVQSEADQKRAIALLEGLDVLVVQDLFLTKTAELADVVLPATAAWAESEGTVTNSERRVQRVRAAVAPPDGARDDLAIIFDLANRMGAGWGDADPEAVWNEVRRLSPVHAGMSYERLEALGGLQWPCYDEGHPGELFLHSRLWEDPVPGNRVPFVPVDHDPPVDRLDDDFPIRLTTGRRLDSYNTGVQTAGYTSPLRRGESLDISPEDASRFSLADGELVRVVSRRGQVEVAIRIDESLRPGLTFMTMHFQDEVAVNLLTIDATDPKSGTAEFKATAIRIEKVDVAIATA
jgi:formate dehydrogenase major subunit